jgi:hypothetical protein
MPQWAGSISGVTVRLRALAWILAAAVAAFAGPARPVAVADGPLPFDQDDLDQIAAPVALYPDPLLAQMLAAATYPAEVAEAIRFADAHPDLRDQELAQRMRAQPWDASVAGLIQFPPVLALFREQPEWARRLGDAVLEQRTAVLETVQELRGLALAQGSLKSTPEQKVISDGDRVLILPARPREVCVPLYDASVVYGAWWLPDRPPVSFKPRRQGVPRIRNLRSADVAFAPCDALSSAAFATYLPDWDDGELTTAGRGRKGTWEHDPAHRRDVPYRLPAVEDRYRPPKPPETFLRGPPSAVPHGPVILRPKPPAAAEPPPDQGAGD